MKLLSNSQRAGELKKPYEDAFRWSYASSIAGLADGVTRTPKTGQPYPAPSPATVAAELAVNRALLALSSSSFEPSLALHQAFESASEGVQELAKLEVNCNYLDADLPGTVLTIVKHINRDLFMGHLGDATVAFLNVDNRLKILTACQTSAVDLWAATQTQFTDMRQRLAHTRRVMRNNPSHPCGYGVLTGEPAALQFVQYTRHKWVDGDLLLLYSDGLSHILGGDLSSRILPPLLAHYVRNGCCSEVIDLAQSLSATSNSRSDDKTIAVFSAD